MTDTIFSGQLPIGQELAVRCGNVATEYVVRFSDGSEVRVTLPPGCALRVTQGAVVSFNVDLYPIAPDDGALRLVPTGADAMRQNEGRGR